MSLIPSESYSFPDHFTSTVIPSPRPKKARPQPVLEKARKKPAIVALPDPEPEPILSQNGDGEMGDGSHRGSRRASSGCATQSSATPRPCAAAKNSANAADQKNSAAPTLKPKVRWNTRAPAMDPARAHNNGNGNGPSEVLPLAQNVIPMKPATPASAPAMMRAPVQQAPPKIMPVQREMRPAQAPAAPQPKPKTPAPVVSNPRTNFFEMFANSDEDAAARRQQQMKFRRFIACETSALLVLLSLVALGLTLNITAPALRWILNVFTIAAAVTVAVTPIVFYAFTPTLPDPER